MYVTQPWTIRQYAGFSTAEDCNAFYRRNIAAGQKGLSVAFDLATHRGYDSDHPRVRGDVGMAGVAIDSIYDMRTLFDGIPLAQMSVSMTMNGAVLPVLALFIVAGEEQGVPPEKLSGTIQNDILKEFMVRNTYIYPPAPSMRIISDIFAYTSRAHAEVQLDLDLRLSHAGGRRDGRPRTRLHARRRRRVRARRRRRRPRHRRVRAAPVVLLGDRHELLHGGRQDARRAPAVGEADQEGVRRRRTSARCRCARTARPRAGRSTAQDVFNNVTRTCIEAMAATQGHTQSLHTNALDEAIALPTDFSARIARNTQLFLQQESGTMPRRRSVGRQLLRRAADRTSSPRKAWAHIEEVEGLGGMAKAIAAGIPKMRIEEAAARTQARIDSGRQTIVGVNKYRVDRRGRDRHPQGRQRQRARAADRQARSGCEAERDRDGRRRRRSTALTEGARGNGNLLDLAVEGGARQGDRRRDLRRHGEGVRPPPRRDPRHLRRLPVGGRQHEQATSPTRAGAGRGVRQERRPPAAHPRRQDGPGRPRPRPEGDRHRRSPTSASTSTSARCSRRPTRRRARRSRTTCTSSACRRWPPAI